MYYVLSTKILQGSDTGRGTVIQKRYSRICGLNPGLIYLQLTKSFYKFISKTELLKIYFSRILITTVTIIFSNAANRTLFP